MSQSLFDPAPFERPPAHGPGCKELLGTRSFRFRGEPRYVCVANCPRREWITLEDRRKEVKR